MLLWTLVYRFCVYMFFLGVHLRVEFPAHRVTLNLTLFRRCQAVFENECTVLHSHKQRVRVQFLYILVNTVFDYSHPSEYEVISNLGFDLHFPSDWGWWASFHILTGHCVSSLEKCLFKSFAHFSIRLVFYYYFWVVRVFYVLWILNPHQIHHLQTFFSQSVGPFHSWKCS